jgi:hypothetical protein
MIRRARLLLPKFAENFQTADLFQIRSWASEQISFQMIILMVGRVLEVSQLQRARLLEALARTGSMLMVYAYPGWSPKSFVDLVVEAGFQQITQETAHCALVRVATR